MIKSFLKICLLVLVGSLIVPTSAPAQTPDNFTINIWHTNDQHSHHRPNRDGEGGSARLATVVNEARASQENVILLDAGDRFSGTLFHYFYQGEANAQVMNAMEYDAMALGNHEFDDGSDILANFIDSTNFPVLSANLNASEDPFLMGLVDPYTILEINGEQIGIIGLITPRTAVISQPEETVTFLEALPAITQQAVDTLEAEGINKIILLTHIGYGGDLELASQVGGVDIIIGGHTNTVPSNYPAQRESIRGEPILIVQAGFHSLFVGHLEVSFDENGVITNSDGEVIRLRADIEEDPTILALVDELEAPVREFTEEVIGQTAFAYSRNCYGRECDIGALITDAVYEETQADIVIQNSGGIREDLPEGDISLGDMLSVLPFGNQVSLFELTGADVLATLEHGVSGDVDGKFPQVAGLQFSWSPSASDGERVSNVEVWNHESETWQMLDLEASYLIASNDFLRGGGDGYEIFRDNAINPYDSYGLLVDIVIDYIETNSPVENRSEGRISIGS